ncbi:UDP-N-acetylglucosamine 2-epimerase [Prochlorococcus marinus]|uniref:UDP-N-acetylglucosamine 2-epimerase n=1 Tax=Prochlorococcus marinus TaxID=1219 RepID=UPI001ADAD397|nr:UDP-N-acetylglucosamine 2-epimerase [Prochlorococcus marinus]
MTKKKICVVVFSRANYARIKSLLKSINNNEGLELQLVVGASALLYRFGNPIDLIRSDGFEPAEVLYNIIEGDKPITMAKSAGLGIIELATIFEKLNPDIVLTVADRFETLSTAVAASYMNIPLAHTQGGEVTGSIDESVRHAITKLSHLHFPATKRSREYILRMGEDPNFVHQVGCPSIDLLVENDLRLESDTLSKYSGVGSEIDLSKNYLVVLQHPVTTEYGLGSGQIEETLKAVKKLGEEGLQIIWLWPNIDAGADDISKGIRSFRETENPKYIKFYKNFSPIDYAKLINNSKCLIGNSSSGIREAAYLGLGSVNIGNRQQDRERGDNVIDCNHIANDIYKAAKYQINKGRYNSSDIFGIGNSGKKIAEILLKTEINIKKRLNYLDE